MAPIRRDDSPGDSLAAQLSTAETNVGILLDALADIARGEGDPITLANAAIKSVTGEALLEGGVLATRISIERDPTGYGVFVNPDMERSPFDPTGLSLTVAHDFPAHLFEEALREVSGCARFWHYQNDQITQSIPEGNPDQ